MSEQTPDISTRVILRVLDDYITVTRSQAYRVSADLAADKAAYKARKDAEDRDEYGGVGCGVGRLHEPDWTRQEKHVALYANNLDAAEKAKSFLIEELLVQYVKPKSVQ